MPPFLNHNLCVYAVYIYYSSYIDFYNKYMFMKMYEKRCEIENYECNGILINMVSLESLLNSIIEFIF